MEEGAPVSSRPRNLTALPPAAGTAAEPRVGWLVHAGGSWRVDFPGNARGPIAARTTLALSPAEWERAARERTGAVLLFENGDPSLPIVIGLVQSATPLVDALLEELPAGAPREARVDGERVVIEGRDEVVLRCGKATLTLRRDGQVIVRGVNVQTEASQVHKIRGGKVQIN
jgi:hypothetical protein